MNIKKLIYILPLILFFVCGIRFTACAQITEYTRDGKDGVWFEVKTDVHDPYRYTMDNKVYKANTIDTFEFRYFDAKGHERFMQYKPRPEKKIDRISNGDTTYITMLYPEYVIADTFSTDSCIHQYSMRVHPDQNRFGQEYNQTVIEFNMLLNGESKAISFSGIVENERNIWMHPDRDCLLRILELNPFPYIQFPAERGKKWSWHLTIGSQWGDKLWKTWEGKIENKYKYKIIAVGKPTETALGELMCAVVKATAKSRIGKTELTAYYNDEYGFVKMEYKNIDGSKIIINLINRELNSKPQRFYH